MTAIRTAWQKLPLVVRTTLWSAARAFLGTLIILVPGVLTAPDFNTAKALAIAALVAAATAAVRVVQHVLQGTVTS